MTNIYSEEPQVLVVDDIAATRAIMRDMLYEMGFTSVVEAADGREALEILKDSRAQLIVCDHMMEDVSGLDLLYQLRNHAYLVDIPFIVVSSCADVTIVETALDLGAADYIVKPISFQLFRRKIVDVLSRRGRTHG
jgi:CheY-like chemotaxis protein